MATAHETSAEEDEIEERLEHALERADPFMAWLGVLFALLVGHELAVELGSGATQVLSIAGWVIWRLFLTEVDPERLEECLAAASRGCSYPNQALSPAFDGRRIAAALA